VTNAYDKMANAKTIDESRDYTDELADSISGLISAFENHEFGTEYFQTAFESLIPKNVYEQFTEAGDRIDSGWEYLNNKLSKYFIFDNNSVSIDFDNIKSFVSDALSTEFGDSAVFTGALENFDLNPQITTLHEFAEAMNLTDTAAFSLGNAVSKYTSDNDDFLSKLSMDGVSLEVQMLSCDQQMASLLQKQSELGKAGKVGTDEWDELKDKISEVNSEMDELQKKARESVTANINIESQIASKQADIETFKKKLSTLTAGSAEYTVTLGNIDYAEKELDKLLQQKYQLEEPTELTIELALEQVQSDIDKTKAELSQIANYDGTTYTLKADCTADSEQFDTLLAQLKQYEQEQIQIKAYAGLEDEATDGLEKIDEFVIKDKNFTVNAKTDAARRALDNIVNTLKGIKDKSATVTVNTIENKITSHAPYIGAPMKSGEADAYGTLGTKSAEKNALVGELGEEILVDPRTGRWQTVGENGAELIDLPKGAIIFNHKQTEELLKNRRIGSRGKAYASGNAYFRFPDKNYTFGSSSSNTKANASVKVEPELDNKALEEQLEKALNKLKEELDNIIGNFEHKIFVMEHEGADNSEIISVYKSMIDTVNKYEDKGRQKGLDANSDYLQELVKQRYEYLDKIRDLTIESYDTNIKEKESAISLNEKWLENAVSKNDLKGIENYTSKIIKLNDEMQDTLHEKNEYYRSLNDKSLKSEIDENSAKWWEYEEAKEEALKKFYEYACQIHENEIALNENWLENAFNANNIDDAKKYTDNIISHLKAQQDEKHSLAEYYRNEKGFSDVSDEVSKLSDEWWELEKQIRDAESQIHEHAMSIYENSVTLTENWLDNAVRDKDFGGITRYASDIISHYKAMQDELHKQAEELRKKGYSDISDEVSSLSDEWWDIHEKMKEVSANAWKEVVNNANEAVDEITGLYDTLKKAAQEFDSSGFITIDTLQEICSWGIEYLAYLKDENGQLVINKDNIHKVIAARTEQMAVETALSYVAQIRNARNKKDIQELARLTLATENLSNATWDLVYAQLRIMRDSGDLNDEMYRGALTNINNLRALTDTALNGIGKVEGGIEEARKAAYEAAKEQADSLDDLLKYVEEMIKQEVKNHVDALKDQVAQMKNIISLQKESLDLEREKDDYSKSVAEKTKKLAELQQQLNMLELDDSRESIAKQADLREEMADLSSDLADEQAYHAYDAAKDMLDDTFEAYEEEKNREIEKLENSISSEEKLYQLAILES